MAGLKHDILKKMDMLRRTTGATSFVIYLSGGAYHDLVKQDDYEHDLELVRGRLIGCVFHVVPCRNHPAFRVCADV